MKPFVKNAADSDQVKEGARKAKSAREQELDDVRQLLALPAGKRFLWRFLENCGVFRSSFDPSGSKVYFNEGTRNVGLMLLTDVTLADPTTYISMLSEFNKEKQRESLETETEKEKKKNDD